MLAITLHLSVTAFLVLGPLLMGLPGIYTAKNLKNILQIGLSNSLSRKVDNCLLWHSLTEVISISPSVGCVFMSCRVYGLH